MTSSLTSLTSCAPDHTFNGVAVVAGIGACDRATPTDASLHEGVSDVRPVMAGGAVPVSGRRCGGTVNAELGPNTAVSLWISENLNATVEPTGETMRDVFRPTQYFTGLADFSNYNRFRSEFFPNSSIGTVKQVVDMKRAPSGHSGDLGNQQGALVLGQRYLVDRPNSGMAGDTPFSAGPGPAKAGTP